jgi:hypothetical protein
MAPPPLTLISNSLTQSSNGAGQFKIIFNNPLNYTGKKVALIKAALTKGQSNVLEEKLTYTFNELHPTPGLKMVVNITEFDDSDSVNTFFLRYQRTVKHESKIMLQTTYSFNKVDKKIRISVLNLTDFNVNLYWKTFVGGTPPGSWTFEGVNTGTQISTEYIRGSGPMARYLTRSTFQLPDHHRNMVTIDPNKTVTLTFSTEHMDLGLPTSTAAYEVFKYIHQIDAEYTPSVMNIRPVTKVFQPGPGHFDTIEMLLLRVNELLDQIGTFSFKNGKVHFQVLPSTPSFKLNFGGLKMHFGFDDNELVYTKGSMSKFIAQRPPDLTRGTLHYFIYCSLIKNVQVNEQMVPLLATVDATQGKYGHQYITDVKIPLFVDCEEGPQQIVEVTIANDNGSIEGLLMGETQLTLAFSD